MKTVQKAKALGLVLVWLGMAGCGVRSERVAPESSASSPASAYAALDRLPNWSGTWGSHNAFPELLAQLKTSSPAAMADLARVNLERFDYRKTNCRQFPFGGHSGGFEGSVEFLFTTERVTMISEDGLVRRIYTDGRALPGEDAEVGSAGASVGHWEGETLIVETQLHPDAGVFLGYLAVLPSLRLGPGARLKERIYSKAPDSLQIDLELTGSSLSQPIKLSLPYRRDPADYRIGEHQYSGCVQHDRSLDPNTGLLRFDLTPPADLPPPPAG